jgi:hypothetical protein
LEEFLDLNVGVITVEQRGVDGNAIDAKEFMEHYTRSNRLKDHQVVIESLKRNPPTGWNGKFLFLGVSDPANPPELKMRLNHLIDLGLVERFSTGRSARYLLCRKYHELVGTSGMYTRKRGLDKGTNKELLFAHLRANAKIGSKFSELQQVLPFLSRSQVQKLLIAQRPHQAITFSWLFRL